MTRLPYVMGVMPSAIIKDLDLTRHGCIFHGELSLEQLFRMRPAPGFAGYRTPMPGLYYASSATHTDGGGCGIPGMQSARAAIADRRAGRRWLPRRS